MNDIPTCIAVTFCCWTCVPTGLVWAKSLGEKFTVPHCLMQPYCAWARHNIRVSRGMPVGDSTLWNDCVVYSCCGPCAVCQDLRQLNGLRVRNADAPPAGNAGVVPPPAYPTAGEPPDGDAAYPTVEVVRCEPICGGCFCGPAGSFQ